MYEIAIPTVISVNVSSGGIPKTPVEYAVVNTDGIEGDDHNHEKHITPKQAVCIIDQEDLEDLCEEGYNVYPGATGENITCRDLNIDELQIGDRLVFSGGVAVELTKMRKPCYVLDDISPDLKEVIVGRCGAYAKIIKKGTLKVGETIQVVTSS